MERKYYLEKTQILELFKNRCVLCSKPAVCLHEIIPKSTNLDWEEFHNRIPVCAECHDKIHLGGTSNSEGELFYLHDKILSDYYGNDYEEYIKENYAS